MITANRPTILRADIVHADRHHTTACLAQRLCRNVTFLPELSKCWLPGTIGVGTIRFDDGGVARFMFWRNLIEPRP
jgi:hypothetical protein